MRMHPSEQFAARALVRNKNKLYIVQPVTCLPSAKAYLVTEMVEKHDV
jgi:hypothetical protein